MATRLPAAANHFRMEITMNAKRSGFLAVLAASLFSLASFQVQAADAPIAPRDGWYNKALIGFEFVRDNVDIPPKKGVMIIDSRPAARQPAMATSAAARK